MSRPHHDPATHATTPSAPATSGTPDTTSGPPDTTPGPPDTTPGTAAMPRADSNDHPAARCTRRVPSRPRQRLFPGHPDQAASARQFVADALTRCPAAADAILLTSELAANALQHTATGAGGDFKVAVIHGPARLRVTVTDNGSDGTPMLVRHAALATSGHGLTMVAALADRWGHYSTQRGRSVWFEIDCPQPQAPSPEKAW